MEPDQLLYAKTHEWVHVADDDDGKGDGRGDGKVVTIGISAFAVEQLTDLVFMELPDVGRVVKVGESIGEIESVKAVSDFYSPVDGNIVATNSELPDQLDRLGGDPYGAGWIAKIKVNDEAGLSDLMDFATYQKQCADGG
jgi:glycine cleavage system H protein